MYFRDFLENTSDVHFIMPKSKITLVDGECPRYIQMKFTELPQNRDFERKGTTALDALISRIERSNQTVNNLIINHGNCNRRK